MRHLSIVAAFTAIVVVAACGGGTGGNPSGVISVMPGVPGGGGSAGGGAGGAGGVGKDTVNVGNNFYSPSALTVSVGSTVTWVWEPNDVIHTVTFDADTTIMSAFQSSGTYARTFTAAGTYSYHCSIHGAAMTGVITAQ
jgi:plastocyanin